MSSRHLEVAEEAVSLGGRGRARVLVPTEVLTPARALRPLVTEGQRPHFCASAGEAKTISNVVASKPGICVARRCTARVDCVHSGRADCARGPSSFLTLDFQLP